MKRHYLRILLPAAALLGMALYYGYPEMLSLRPQSIHHWRQSDCASLALQYYQHDLALGEPHIHGLVADSGTTARNAPSEVAAYYWLIGKLYHLTGPDERLLRGLNTLLFLTGIFAFCLTLYRASGRLRWAVPAGLLLFTSPVLVYYGNNYLSNAPSFGLALCGLSALHAFWQKRQMRYWVLCGLSFALAGALKLPGLLLFFALGGAVLFFPKSLTSPGRQRYFFTALIILVPLAAWVLYARHYNQEHHTVYFSTTVFPLWDYSWPRIQIILQEIARAWGREYFHPATATAFFLILLSLPFWHRRLPRVYPLLLGFLLLQILVYLLLQFYTFMSHDYYTINLFMLPALLLLMLSCALRQKLQNPIRASLLGTLMLLITAANAYYAKQRLEFRYREYPNEFYHQNQWLYEDGEAWLTSVGVAPDDTIIFIEDASHTSLYLLNRFGFTTHIMERKDTALRLPFNQSAAGIERSMAAGASHLVVSGADQLYHRPYLQKFTHHLLAQREGILAFDLQHPETNFTLPEARVVQEILFDFEQPGKLPGTDAFRQSHENGTYLEIPASETYAALYQTGALEAGMKVSASVWLHAPESAKLLPVIASEEAGLAFAQSSKIKDTRQDWRLMEQELIIDTAMAPRGVRVFIWNPSAVDYRADSLKIEIMEVNPLLR